MLFAKRFCGVLLAVACMASLSSGADLTIRLQDGASVFGATYAGTEDTYLHERYPFATPGKHVDNYIGFDNTLGGGKARMLLRFDLSSLNSSWGATTQITGARIVLNFAQLFGNAFTNTPIKVYRVSTANKSWVAGQNTSRVASEGGSACWSFRSFNSALYEPSHATCPLCHRDEPWKGDISNWLASTGTFSWGDSIGRGCGVAGTDHSTTAVGTATVSSTAVGTSVTITLTDISYLRSWIQSHSNNEGFMIMAPDLEALTYSTYAMMRIPAADNVTQNVRPTLEIDFTNLNAISLGGFSYTIHSAGKVSAIISNADGKVVKELLHAASRNSGVNYEAWDCKDDPLPQRNDTATTVPDGNYTVKIMQHTGITAEYLMTLGTSQDNIFAEDQFPGNHVTPGGIDVDSTGVYIGSHLAEGCAIMRKQTAAGTLLWSSQDGNPWGWFGPAKIAAMDSVMHIMSLNGYYYRHSTKRTNAFVGSRVDMKSTGFTGEWCWDIAAGGGKVIVANTGTGAGICWVNPSTGAKIGTQILIANVKGVAMDARGVAYVVIGTSIMKYAQGSTTPTAFISTNLVKPDQLSINKTNGDIYVMDNGTMQVKVFGSNGALKSTLGKLGGRKPYGRWHPETDSGFYFNATGLSANGVNQDIAVAPDGSFYIAEQQPMRRVAHYSATGAFVKEWYTGGAYCPGATPEPADPRYVWYGGEPSSTMRMLVDYANRTWKPVGIYLTNRFNGQNWGGGNPVNRGGRTYLVSSGFPTVSLLDGDSLKLISSGGYAKDSISSNIRHAVSDYGLPAYSAADLNGNGIFESGEVSAGPKGVLTNPQGFYRLSNYTDSNFVTYGHMFGDNWITPDTVSYSCIPGPTVYTPELAIVNNITVPKYNLLTGLRNPFKHQFIAKEPTASNWAGFGGAVVDANGDIYYSWLGNRFDTAATGPTYFTGNMQWSFGSARIAKCNRTTGDVEWVVGKYAPSGTPNPGSLRQITRLLGVGKSCVFVAEFNGSIQHIYNEDGLYVGRILDSKQSINGVPLPDNRTMVCDEQWSGKVVEVTRDDIPGLTKGDVLFFGGSNNAVNVFKVHGLNTITKMQTTVTVVNGQITGQGPVGIAGQNPQNPVNRTPMPGLSIFRHGTQLSVGYTIPAAVQVQIELYTVLGQKVATLVDKKQSAGNYTVGLSSANLNGRHLTNGFYVVRLIAGSARLTKQVVAVR